MPELSTDETLPKACPRCLEQRGLCASCAQGDRSLLPQLAQPAWVKMIRKRAPRPVPAAPELPAVPALGTPGRRAQRLARALAGQFTRSASVA